jgi:hypothetical protein
MGRYDGTIYGTYTQGLTSLLKQDDASLVYDVDRDIESPISHPPDVTKNNIWSTYFGDTNTGIEIDDTGLSPVSYFTEEASNKIDTPPAIGQSSTIFSRRNFDGSNTEYLFEIACLGADNYVFRLKFKTFAGSTNYTITSSSFTEEQLRFDENQDATSLHVVAVRDIDSAYIYVNNEIVASGTHNNSLVVNTTDKTMIGDQQYSPGYNDTLIGNIGPVCYWNRALTSEEISKHYIASQLEKIYLFFEFLHFLCNRDKKLNQKKLAVEMLFCLEYQHPYNVCRPRLLSLLIAQ